ncbi:hypothetical protein AB0I61_28805 [Polymorphospora rubra]|uniref:hypothetical protein n=1 Tax=Polymorphospora rubra TaxID=338584 RepID=UPI0034083FA2
MTEARIRSAAAMTVDGRDEPAPEELITAMVRFEERYGGLRYPVIGSRTTVGPGRCQHRNDRHRRGRP